VVGLVMLWIATFVVGKCATAAYSYIGRGDAVCSCAGWWVARVRNERMSDTRKNATFVVLWRSRNRCCCCCLGLDIVGAGEGSACHGHRAVAWYGGTLTVNDDLCGVFFVPVLPVDDGWLLF
jgi:hypothetical protein